MSVFLHNSSAFEIVWTLLGACALVFNWVNYQDAAKDLDAVKQSGQNGRYLLVAKQNHRNEFARFLKQLGFVAIGAMFMFTPPSVVEQVTVASYAAAFVLMCMQVWLVIGAYLDRVTRSKLDRLIAKENDRRALDAATGIKE